MLAMRRSCSLLFACLVLVGWSPAAQAADPAASAAATPTAPPAPVHTGSFFWLPRGNRWFAASLSMGFNGLGQLYNEEPEKGYGMMAGWLTFPLAYGFDALTGRAYGRLFSYTVNLGIKGWSVVDAFNAAAPYPTPSPHP
ncbi:MAG: hypothetical protein JWM80_1289 [Cyanobacteria bacterium RYN_339]|nr:hypothetical protein [Cyanobacteria bacterium RYN_339]